MTQTQYSIKGMEHFFDFNQTFMLNIFSNIIKIFELQLLNLQLLMYSCLEHLAGILGPFLCVHSTPFLGTKFFVIYSVKIR